jgi:dGTPase
VRQQFPGIAERRIVNETVRRMINTLIVDLTEESTRRIAAAAPASIDEVRKAGPLIAFSPALRAERMSETVSLRQYRHYQ